MLGAVPNIQRNEVLRAPLLVKFVVAIAFVTACGQRHDDASVPVVTAETDDSIAFRISVPKKFYGEMRIYSTMSFKIRAADRLPRNRTSVALTDQRSRCS